MRLVLNILLALIALFLCYLLYDSIKEPIAFDNDKELREGAVVERLEDLRTSQELYRSITGEFAPTYDTLREVLTTRDLFKIKLTPDENFPEDTDKAIRDTTFYNTVDSLNAMGINLDSIMFVPFSGGEKFSMTADTITFQQTLVHVMEAGASRKLFMGRWSDPKYAKYDDTYDPAKVIKFGDMTAPSLSGNWE